MNLDLLMPNKNMSEEPRSQFEGTPTSQNWVDLSIKINDAIEFYLKTEVCQCTLKTVLPVNM